VSAAAASGATCGSQHCITCSDDGEPMEVVRVDGGRGLALCVGEDGARITVETALLEAVLPGERVLVHAGTAIARLEPGDEVAA
jgi:hydrogenase maturation factor